MIYSRTNTGYLFTYDVDEDRGCYQAVDNEDAFDLLLTNWERRGTRWMHARTALTQELETRVNRIRSTSAFDFHQAIAVSKNGSQIVEAGAVVLFSRTMYQGTYHLILDPVDFQVDKLPIPRSTRYRSDALESLQLRGMYRSSPNGNGSVLDAYVRDLLLSGDRARTLELQNATIYFLHHTELNGSSRKIPIPRNARVFPL